MPNYTKIKSKKLQNELKKSERFKLMSEKEKQNTINRIAKLPLKEQKNFIKVMEEENEFVEKKFKRSKEEQIPILKAFIEEITNITAKFEKLAHEDTEKINRKKEKKQEKELLDQLKNL